MGFFRPAASAKGTARRGKTKLLSKRIAKSAYKVLDVLETPTSAWLGLHGPPYIYAHDLGGEVGQARWPSRC